MRNMSPPFKFDFGEQLRNARRKLNSRVGSVSINLPFMSFSLNPDDIEKRVAREIVIRMADRRVLNSFECCDNCINHALTSLNEIRCMLTDKQVEISEMADGPLYCLIELQLEAIRQFLTFEQRLNESFSINKIPLNTQNDRPKTPLIREQYFVALEMLRAHLHRCLIQVSKIADISIPKISDNMRYDEAWQLEAYEKPLFFIESNGT